MAIDSVNEYIPWTFLFVKLGDVASDSKTVVTLTSAEEDPRADNEPACRRGRLDTAPE